MRKQTHAIALSAALTLGGGLTAATLAQDSSTVRTTTNTPTQGHNDASDLALPAGIKTISSQGEMNDIRECLQEVFSGAVTKDAFDDLCERLVDRKRLGDIDEKTLTTLNGIAEQIRKDFQAKYSKDINIPDDAKETVFKGGILHGEVTDAALVVNHWPLPATGAMSGGNDARMAGERVAPRSDDAKERAADAKEDKIERKSLENGQNVAVYRMPASHGLPAITVSLIQEPAWHIDVPDRLSAEQLRTNLEKHLTMVKDQKDQWPADINEARSMIAHHVLMALYDVSMQQESTGSGNGMK